MNPAEVHLIKQTLDTLEAGFVKRAKELWASLLPEIEPYVEDVLRTGKTEDFELPGRKRYIVLFKRFIQELYAQGMNLADRELETRRLYFDDQVQSAPIIPVDAMNWTDQWVKVFGEDYYGDVTKDVVRVLKDSLALGWSTKDTMDELGNHLTGPRYNQARLETIARTNATTAFNQGRLETFRQAGDFVEYVQFLAILDSRTTAICESRHGRIMRLDDPALASNTPPLHYQCRSLLSPVTKFDLRDMEKPGWKDEDGKSFEELLDWGKLEPPAKGFGELGKVIGRKGADSKAVDSLSEGKSGLIEKSSRKIDKKKAAAMFKKYPEVESEIEYKREGKAFKIGGYKKRELAFIEEALNKIPSEHFKGLKSINVTNNVLIVNYDGIDYIVGAAYDDLEKAVYLDRRRIKLSSKQGTEIMKSSGSIFHEIGHSLYFNSLTQEMRDEISRIAQEDGMIVFKNTAPHKNTEEYFADAYSRHLTARKLLYRKRRKIYNIIAGLFKR